MSEEQVPASSAASAAEQKEVCDDENLHELVMKKLNLSEEKPILSQVMKDLSFDGLIDHWKENGFKNIITMVGAGISTAAGIPDFRSPGSGLYANLQKYELEHPEDIFDLSFFHYNPKPFFALAKELYPGTFRPTSTHFFVQLLHQKGVLLRHYTQNIDTLERVAGIPEEKLVEAHGTFYTNHCTRCSRSYTMEWMKEKIFNDELPRCEDARCKAVVKPDIVFFGEGLPSRFHRLPDEDFKKCDLLIIMGTSLEVYPFAGLIERPKRKCVRLLINKYKVGSPRSHFPGNAGLMYDNPKNRRDVAYIGSCDEAVWKMATELGWADELKALEKEFVLKGSPDQKLAKSSSIRKDGKEKQKESKSNSESKPKM